MMKSDAPILSAYARRKKIDYFLRRIPPHARVLEIGSGSGWVGAWLTAHTEVDYVGLDLLPPADVVGDIKQWRKLDLRPESFDVIVAFEVVEHVDCFQECHDLLKPAAR